MNRIDQFNSAFLSLLQLKVCGHYVSLFYGKNQCHISLKALILSSSKNKYTGLECHEGEQ